MTEESYNSMTENPIGEVSPILAYGNDKIGVILNYNGILIYDMVGGDLIQGIDNEGLGMS